MRFLLRRLRPGLPAAPGGISLEADSAVLAQPMTRLEADAVVEGRVTGRGDVLPVDNQQDLL